MTLRILLLVLVCSTLQGCLPLVVTGAGAGVMLAQDRRSKEAYIEDQQIETRAMRRIGEQFRTPLHANVTSYNRKVLISGEAPDEATRTEIGKIISGMNNVQEVDNELSVSPVSSLASRSTDGLITSSVKLRFINDQRFSADHIKVVTEKGTVYLMGIVRRVEADAAADVASTTQGVRRVVRMFEYMD